LTGTPVRQSQSQDVKRELLMLSLPAIAGQALEPLAQLMETAYIGRLGTLWFLYIYIYIYIFCSMMISSCVLLIIFWSVICDVFGFFVL